MLQTIPWGPSLSMQNGEHLKPGGMYSCRASLHGGQLLFPAFTLVSIPSLDTCRTLEFVEPTEDNYLENHVRKSILVDNNDQCKLRCYLDDFCLSYNFGIQETGDKFTCELSDSDHYQHPEHLICKKGFSYHPTMVGVHGFVITALLMMVEKYGTKETVSLNKTQEGSKQVREKYRLSRYLSDIFFMILLRGIFT